jgi:hypothetical protein
MDQIFRLKGVLMDQIFRLKGVLMDATKDGTNSGSGWKSGKRFCGSIDGTGGVQWTIGPFLEMLGNTMKKTSFRDRLNCHFLARQSVFMYKLGLSQTNQPWAPLLTLCSLRGINRVHYFILPVSLSLVLSYSSNGTKFLSVSSIIYLQGSKRGRVTRTTIRSYRCEAPSIHK